MSVSHQIIIQNKWFMFIGMCEIDSLKYELYIAESESGKHLLRFRGKWEKNINPNAWRDVSVINAAMYTQYRAGMILENRIQTRARFTFLRDCESSILAPKLLPELLQIVKHYQDGLFVPPKTPVQTGLGPLFTEIDVSRLEIDNTKLPGCVTGIKLYNCPVKAFAICGESCIKTELTPFYCQWSIANKCDGFWENVKSAIYDMIINGKLAEMNIDPAIQDGMIEYVPHK